MFNGNQTLPQMIFAFLLQELSAFDNLFCNICSLWDFKGKVAKKRKGISLENFILPNFSYNFCHLNFLGKIFIIFLNKLIFFDSFLFY